MAGAIVYAVPKREYLRAVFKAQLELNPNIKQLYDVIVDRNPLGKRDAELVIAAEVAAVNRATRQEYLVPAGATYRLEDGLFYAPGIVDTHGNPLGMDLEVVGTGGAIVLGAHKCVDGQNTPLSVHDVVSGRPREHQPWHWDLKAPRHEHYRRSAATPKQLVFASGECNGYVCRAASPHGKAGSVDGDVHDWLVVGMVLVFT